MCTIYIVNKFIGENMVKLRKGHTKLKLALIAVLGFIIGLGGTVGIWWGYSYIQGLKGTPDVSVENKQNYHHR